MSKFWPSDININDIQSPKQILKIAQKEWEDESNGVMTLDLQDTQSKSGNSMVIVYAKHIPSNRTSTLFSVIHRPNNPYPVTIQLQNQDLPDYLKKVYISPALTELVTSVRKVNSLQGYSNPWVSETPAEFREKLAEVLSDGSIKGQILNLVADDWDAPDYVAEETGEEPAES